MKKVLLAAIVALVGSAATAQEAPGGSEIMQPPHIIVSPINIPPGQIDQLFNHPGSIDHGWWQHLFGDCQCATPGGNSGALLQGPSFNQPQAPVNPVNPNDF